MQRHKANSITNVQNDRLRAVAHRLRLLPAWHLIDQQRVRRTALLLELERPSATTADLPPGTHPVARLLHFAGEPALVAALRGALHDNDPQARQRLAAWGSEWGLTLHDLAQLASAHDAELLQSS